MKILFQEIVEENPCFDGICKLLSYYNLEESVRANPELLKFLNWKLDSDDFSDEKLNELDLRWAYNRGIIAACRHVDILESFEDFSVSSCFTMSPIGDAIGFFDASCKRNPEFINGDFCTVTRWDKISPKQADYFSMVLTDLMEWCFFPIYEQENAKYNNHLQDINFCDRIYNGHKY